MKQVFNSSEVAHVWAQQKQDKGRNAHGNFYFEGATIYSYGRHFPIATIEGNDVLFTLRTYSNTTAKHLISARSAVSHKNIIYCYNVPVKYWNDKKPLNKQSFTSEHFNNLDHWKKNIKSLFAELGNKRNRKIQNRVSEINYNISQLNNYCQYFGIKVKDKELKKLLSVAQSTDFIDQARQAKEKEDKAKELRLSKAIKAYDIYIDLWRKFDNDAINDLPQTTKDLVNYYAHNSGSFTRLRLNTDLNRIETSKGVQIPVPIAKKAFIALNGCMEGNCDKLSIDVMNYTITKTTDKAIIAGCHTIPKEDIRYIAQLLNW